MDKKAFYTILAVFLTLKGIYWLLWRDITIEPMTTEGETELLQRSLNKEKQVEKPEKTMAPSQVEKLKEKSPDDIKKQLLERWKEFKSKADAQNKECEKSVQQLLPNDNLIDPEDPFFNNRNNVMRKLEKVVSKTLLRRAASQGYWQLQDIIKHNLIDDPLEAYQGLIFFDSVCRNFKSLNYLDTVLEVGSLQKWSLEKRKEVNNFLLTQVWLMTSSHSSSSNMGYIVSLLEGMIERGFLSSEYKQELQTFIQKVIDLEDIFTRSFDGQNKEAAVKNMDVLKDYVRENENLGKELLDLIGVIIDNNQ